MPKIYGDTETWSSPKSRIIKPHSAGSLIGCSPSMFSGKTYEADGNADCRYDTARYHRTYTGHLDTNGRGDTSPLRLVVNGRAQEPHQFRSRSKQWHVTWTTPDRDLEFAVSVISWRTAMHHIKNTDLTVYLYDAQ